MGLAFMRLKESKLSVFENFPPHPNPLPRGEREQERLCGKLSHELLLLRPLQERAGVRGLLASAGHT